MIDLSSMHGVIVRIKRSSMHWSHQSKDGCISVENYMLADKIKTLFVQKVNYTFDSTRNEYD